MKISQPCEITSRLLLGVRIGDVWISIDYAERPGDEWRTRYRWYIDGLGREYSGDELQSGRGHYGLQYGLENLLAFLGASVGDSELFPSEVIRWAMNNADELASLAEELRCGKCIEE